MLSVPIFISFCFILTTIVTLLLFYWIIKTADDIIVQTTANRISLGLLLWLIIQSILALLGVYNTNMGALPPKILLFGVLPIILVIVSLFTTTIGKRFIDSLSLQKMMFIHIVRIPVEIVLFGLFLYKTVPKHMTFEGLNFDIVAGISSLIIIYFGYKKTKTSNLFLLIWNIVCLGLLINIIAIAILSAPSPLQKIALEQPNIAILYFPFCFLPTFIVPIVLFSHLASIRQLIKRNQIKNH